MDEIKNFNIVRRAMVFITIVLLAAVPSSAASNSDLIADITEGGRDEFKAAQSIIEKTLPAQIPSKLKEEYLDQEDLEPRLRIISTLKLYNSRENLHIWEELLRASDRTGTETAIMEIFEKIEEAAPVTALAEKLRVPRITVREKAAILLQKIGNDRAFPVIIPMASSSIAVERIYFLQALKHLYDRRFFSTVISMLDDKEKSVRIYALQCLTSNDVRDSIPRIRSLILRETNSEVKIEGILSLMNFKDTRSSYILLKTIKDRDDRVRLVSVKALAGMDISSSSYSLSNMLRTEQDRTVRGAIIDALISFRNGGGMNGLRYIIEKENNTKLRIKAAFALGEIREESETYSILKKALSDGDYRVRGEACNALGRLKKAGVSGILIETITNEKSRYVRSAALYALKRIDDRRNTTALFDIYSGEKDPLFREMLRLYIRKYIIRYSK